MIYSLAVIPSRMGSKRIPRKNQQHIGLETLEANAIRCAMESGVFDTVCLVSDRERPENLPDGVQFLQQPDILATDQSGIAEVTQWATISMEKALNGSFLHVATLQPAVLARSGLIIRRLYEGFIAHNAGGALTMARTIPWQWHDDGDWLEANWTGPYPRSQACTAHFAEVNACQITTRAAVGIGKRWVPPLVVAELPEWAVSLDIDDWDELDTARDLWPFAQPRLETWDPPIHGPFDVTGVVS